MSAICQSKHAAVVCSARLGRWAWPTSVTLAVIGRPSTNCNEKKRSERRKHCARAGCNKVRTPPARLPVANTQTHRQWRRSVVKSEGSGSLRSSYQTRSRPKLAFVFGAKNGLFGHFRPFRVWPKMNFLLLFFVFIPKNVICVGPKMLCSQLNRN